MDKRLIEHLERVRQLSDHVTRIHEQLARNRELMTREPETPGRTPLQAVRDVRQHSSGSRSLSRSEAADRRRSRRRR